MNTDKIEIDIDGDKKPDIIIDTAEPDVTFICRCKSALIYIFKKLFTICVLII